MLFRSGLRPPAPVQPPPSPKRERSSARPLAMSVPRPSRAALLLLVPLLALSAGASDVVELSDADFESGLAERPGLVLVEFFAPW